MRISLISVSERANKFVLRARQGLYAQQNAVISQQTFVHPHPYSPTFHNVHDGTPYTLR
ncbi:hypothetical protein JI435_414030 [Parastagonospora nodorum SN15]|uniref:Uncharacterized protein n=1 Tax=Phaeosphaeria nodorum (strain SN15 / ATCC MYA-4574 / FGSC 10173) TaxID=321614 RepID=A0A7U2F6V2_PHANO|nr:hypothetical protein JI435_414030 [Parastagonospora nodorum SN15]